MTQEDFMNNVLGKAQKLCSPSGQRLIENKKVAAPTSKADVDPESFGRQVSSTQDDTWDKMFLSEAAYGDGGAQPKKTPQQRPITKSSVTKSRVPDFIKESMLTNSIDTSALSDNPLDRMDLSRFQLSSQPEPVKQQVNEVVSLPAQTQSQPTGIDYSLIMAIMNECIDKKFKEYGLSKEMLTEGTLKSIHLKGGSINIVDNSGNIYSAKLKKEGNVNEK